MPTEISGSTGVNKIQDGTVVNADINSSAAIAGSKLVMPAGSMLQTVYTDGMTAFASTSQTYVDTPLTVTITPKFTSSKIIVTMKVMVWPSHANYMYFRFKCSGGVTNSNIATYGDFYESTSGSISIPSSYSFEHSPNTTSAVTYTMQARSSASGNWYAPNNNSNADINKRYSSIAMEIAG